MEIRLGEENICQDFALYMKEESFKPHLHYISAISSFPISKLTEILPMSENKEVYDRINVLSAVDLQELNACIKQLYQRIIFNTTAKDLNTEQTSKIQNGVEDRHWLYIDGIQTMFQLSQLQDQVQAHAALNNSLLRLRLLHKKCNSVKVMFQLPKTEAPEFVRHLREREEDEADRNRIANGRDRHSNKRFKRDNTGILIGDYLWKYYM